MKKLSWKEYLLLAIPFGIPVLVVWQAYKVYNQKQLNKEVKK